MKGKKVNSISFRFAPSFRGPPHGPGPRAPKLLRMALETHNKKQEIHVSSIYLSENIVNIHGDGDNNVLISLSSMYPVL